MADISVSPPEDWEKKEQDYQQQIENLRKLNEKLLSYSEEKAKSFEQQLQKLQHEKDLVQKKLDKMELDELRDAASGTTKNIEAFKEKYNTGELLLIFLFSFFQIKVHLIFSFKKCSRFAF
jgi:vacuolar-type H+-ATPase subunit H